VTTVWAIGAYTVYTYISPFLSLSTGLSRPRPDSSLTLLGTAAIGGVTLAASPTIGSVRGRCKRSLFR